MKKIYCLLCLCLFTGYSHAQVIRPIPLRISLPDSARLYAGLDTLLTQIKLGNVGAELLYQTDSAFSRDIFLSLKGMGDSLPGFDMPQLINCYEVQPGNYVLTLAYMQSRSGIKALIEIMAHVAAERITFSTPLQYYTRNWQTKKVGNVLYHYPDHINLKTATSFDQKNTTFARKLQLPVESLDFYLCDQYQEILHLIGYAYDQSSNGRTRDGYGVVAGKIFSVMHSEDFSHDLVHDYVWMFRTNTRNGPAEEGLAYTWGNAYYTDANGIVIEQHTLVMALKAYLVAHPGADLLELFNTNPKIFNDIAKEVSVKTTIASVICDEIERTKGIAGIKTLVNCGRGDDHYFAMIYTLAGIDKTNFNTRVATLLQLYK